jgi:HAD superfamily hydrolase (TIGR01484 family)
MKQPSLILATDLDGTFLGGSNEQKKHLYDWLRSHDNHLLIFVTGRDLPFIQDLIHTPGMPAPHYIIGDIGTSVFDGATFQPIHAMENDIAAAWGDGAQRIADMLDNEPCLKLQPGPFRYRRSYYYRPDSFSPDILQRVEEAGYDWILSADRFFDVVPKGVSKGPTLLRVLAYLGLPQDKVLVAGDTLNDLSLFETGLKGVAVGGSEESLLNRVRAIPTVYQSPAPGAAGIWDALNHYQLSTVKEIES